MVGFTDKDKKELEDEGYFCDTSVLGNVFYRTDGVDIHSQIEVNYMEYPWISTFEVEGLKIDKARWKELIELQKEEFPDTAQDWEMED